MPDPTSRSIAPCPCSLRWTSGEVDGLLGGPSATGQFFVAVDAETTSSGAFAGRVADPVAAIAEQPGARVHGADRKAARAPAAALPIGVDRVIVEKVRGLAA